MKVSLGRLHIASSQNVISRSRVAAFLGVSLMLVVGALSFREFQRAAENSEWVDHTYRVIQQLDATRQALLEAESQQRTYVVTGQPQFLEGYQSSVERAKASLEAFQRLTADNPLQQQQIVDTRAALQGRYDWMARVVETRNRDGVAAATTMIASGKPAEAMKVAMEALDRHRNTESQLLSRRTDETARSTRRSATMLLTVIILAAVLILAAAMTVRRHVAALFAANEALGHANDALAGENAKRRHAEGELEKRAAELARSNADLEQFAYIASHDLQEPLRMVASYTELLGRRYRGRLDQDADDFIAFAIDGVKRMQALIDDLLQYARLTNDSKTARRPVDLSVVVDDVVRLYGATIDETSARIDREPLPTVPGSPTLLRQLFRNLIGNALKFRDPERPPVVHIGAVANADTWEVTISDNGIGVQPEFKDRIFAIFQRLHAREKYPGTGMGLTICKRIVEKHGGTIWVEQAPGGGAAFHLTLRASAEAM